MHAKISIALIAVLFSKTISAQPVDPYKPDFSAPKQIPGMELAWNDEFNTNGRPNPLNWKYETGFVRNQELQWYQASNASCINGVLLIEGRREKVPNPAFKDSSANWKLKRQYAEYTSASLKTQGLQQWQYGRVEVRARIDTAMGSWPAIWTLGISGRWPLNGEVDMMEFYRVGNTPTLLANIAWGANEKGAVAWNSKKIPLTSFTAGDAAWTKKFHIWRMDWNKDSMNLYLDDVLLNAGLVDRMHNADGSSPFLQPQYLLLNLAIGANGGDPANTPFPVKYEVDYVRYYKK